MRFWRRLLTLVPSHSLFPHSSQGLALSPHHTQPRPFTMAFEVCDPHHFSLIHSLWPGVASHQFSEQQACSFFRLFALNVIPLAWKTSKSYHMVRSVIAFSSLLTCPLSEGLFLPLLLRSNSSACYPLPFTLYPLAHPHFSLYQFSLPTIIYIEPFLCSLSSLLLKETPGGTWSLSRLHNSAQNIVCMC